MAYISKGDMLVTNSGKVVIAAGSDYLRRTTSGGEYLEDWTVVPTVDTLDPETGLTGWYRLSDVRKA